MKFIIDMNMSMAWVTALSDAGHEAQHWFQCGSPTSTDAEIANAARVADAVILTRDLDFSAILAATMLRKPSVVHLRDEDRFEPSLVRRVLLALSAFQAELDAGAILTIAGNRARIRTLPL